MHHLLAFLRKLAVTAVFLGFLELLLPEGDLRRFARVILGLLVVLVLLQPLVALVRGGFDLERLMTEGVAAPPVPADTGAARLTAAGLSALTQAARADMERRVEELCRKAGAAVGSIEIAVTAGSVTGLTIQLRGPGADPARLRTALAAELGMPVMMIEVLADG